MGQTRFTPDIDLDGLPADEAFVILGNEIRLAVIRVLWRANAAHEYDDGSDSVKTMTYSALQNEVGIEDNGRFNYHLSQLAPHFIRRTADGYRLSSAGKQIARTVIAVSGAGDLDFSSELAAECPICGGHVVATYEDQWLRVSCTECEGLFGDQAPVGTLFLTNYPAAGLADRTPEDALESGLYRCALDITYMMYDICRECAGHISASVTVCDEHESRENHPCANCGTPFPVWADMRCDTCRFAKRLPVEMFVTGLTMITGLIDTHEAGSHSVAFDDAIDLLQHGVETSVTRDPLRLSVTIEMETTSVAITLDDEMNVVSFDQESTVDPAHDAQDLTQSS